MKLFDTMPSLLDRLKQIKSNLMHQRRFGADTMNAWRTAASQAEGDIEELLAGVVTPSEINDQLAAMEARKDAAYLERNQVVAALAKCFPSGVGRTAIEGWSEDWHGCVYIDLPTGQAGWHFHDSQAYLFEGLPEYDGAWDGHTTEVKYQRLAALMDGRHHLREKLNLVELAIHEYHAALDQREHGGVAQSRAISQIENCLGIHWQVGPNEPRFEPDADLVHQVAKGLIFIAEEAGQVITIERTPRRPLAMGNADYLVSVRPKRERT